MPKISELNPLTNLSSDDLVPVVNDPNGAPSNNKITFNNFANSVLNYIGDKITGNVSFSNTTMSTKYVDQDLILTSQNGKVSVFTPDYKWNFINGDVVLESNDNGLVMAIGEGMGPTIYANTTLYIDSMYSNTETNETWDHGSVMYPGSHQMWTQYSNNEVGLGRNSTFTLYSDINNISAEISLFDTNNNYTWRFDVNGNLILPISGDIKRNGVSVIGTGQIDGGNAFTAPIAEITVDGGGA